MVGVLLQRKILHRHWSTVFDHIATMEGVNCRRTLYRFRLQNPNQPILDSVGASSSVSIRYAKFTISLMGSCVLKIVKEAISSRSNSRYSHVCRRERLCAIVASAIPSQASSFVQNSGNPSSCSTMSVVKTAAYRVSGRNGIPKLVPDLTSEQVASWWRLVGNPIAMVCVLLDMERLDQYRLDEWGIVIQSLLWSRKFCEINSPTQWEIDW